MNFIEVKNNYFERVISLCLKKVEHKYSTDTKFCVREMNYKHAATGVLIKFWSYLSFN